MTQAQAANLIGTDSDTLNNWSARGFGPHPAIVNGAPTYDRGQVADFVVRFGPRTPRRGWEMTA